MRTTLTIEPSIAALLREVMRRQKITLKAAINEARREGISRIGARLPERKRFVVEPVALGLKPGINPDKISRYGDEIYDIEKLRKSAD